MVPDLRTHIHTSRRGSTAGLPSVQLFVGYDEASHAMGFKPLYLALAFGSVCIWSVLRDGHSGWPEITVRRNKVALDILLLAESPNPVELVENRNVQGLSPSA